jgi:hypothetical protein
VIVTEDISKYLSVEDQEDFLQALDERSHKASYAITVSNELIIRELPSSPHEAVITSIEFAVCAENIRRTGKHTAPLHCLRSRRTNYLSTLSRSSYEADTSFRNMNIGDPPTERNRTLIESIIFEVGFSESIDSLVNTGFHYLSNIHVKIVISVKLIGSGNRVDEMVYIVQERDRRGQPIITRAVNFGPPLSEATVVSIQRRLLGRVRLEGVGIDDAATYPLLNPCAFDIMIPASYIYGDSTSPLDYRIPVGNIADYMREGHIELP